MKRLNKSTLPTEGIPVELYEVSDTPVTLSAIRDAENFLGLPFSTLTRYVDTKSKIIKSKKDGKTYVVKLAKK